MAAAAFFAVVSSGAGMKPAAWGAWQIVHWAKRTAHARQHGTWQLPSGQLCMRPREAVEGTQSEGERFSGLTPSPEGAEESRVAG